MLAVTDRFLEELRESHQVSVAAFVYRPTALATPIPVPVVGGTVTMDRDARVRRQGTLIVAFDLADEFTVQVLRELPYGGYATVERGVRFADGTEERVQLGRFRIEAITWTQLEGRATLVLADRMAQVQDEPFTAPYVPSGHPSDAAVAIVQQVFGGLIAYHILTTPASEPTLDGTTYDQDRAQAVSDLAAAVAAEVFFDNLGDFVIRPRDLPHSPVWSVDAGARGVMVEAVETLDRSSVRNGVAVRGQPAADLPPIYSLATFDDPSSPIRWGGPFGKVALISESTAVSSQAQADATARSLLNLRLGLARTMELSSIPNPALEVNDEIALVFADGRTETQSVNALEIGLEVDGALRITTTSKDQPVAAMRAATVRLAHGAQVWRELESATVLAE